MNIEATLSDPRDVLFALRAVLGPGASPDALQAAAAHLPATPTLQQLVSAALGQGPSGTGARRACALLATYFDLDPATDPDILSSP